MQTQDIVLQDQFLTLIREINAKNINTTRELTSEILYTLFCVYTPPPLYLSLLYRLIFYTHKDVACHILCGFIEFGQSTYGMPYKPMLDYFVVEAFRNLLTMKGWSILKPCVIALRSTINNYTTEPLFKYIVSCSVNQLKQDESSSDICYHLPREKSFTWGWFSYEIARAYYSHLNAGQNVGQTAGYNAKQMRNMMMLYRKLLTKLRKNGLVIVTITETPAIKIEESWSGIIAALEEYKWADEFIIQLMDDEGKNEEVDEEDSLEENTEIEDEGAEPLEETLEEPIEEKIEIEVQEPQAEPQIGVEGAEPLEEPLIENKEIEVQKPLIKNKEIEVQEPLTDVAGGVVGGDTPPIKGWLYNLFGWH